MSKWYILLAHTPINADDEAFVEDALLPCEWRIYNGSEAPRLRRDHEKWRTLYREVQVREVSAGQVIP